MFGFDFEKNLFYVFVSIYPTKHVYVIFIYAFYILEY
jgi:hypothetical protein